MSTELDVYLTCVLASMLVMSEEKKKDSILFEENNKNQFLMENSELVLSIIIHKLLCYTNSLINYVDHLLNLRVPFWDLVGRRWRLSGLLARRISWTLSVCFQCRRHALQVYECGLETRHQVAVKSAQQIHEGQVEQREAGQLGWRRRTPRGR